MDPNVVATKVATMVMTDKAMEVLQRNLRKEREIRSIICDYCHAQPGDPCHSARGRLLTHYHVGRIVQHHEEKEKCPDEL
jgi:hypothetical protein